MKYPLFGQGLDFYHFIDLQHGRTRVVIARILWYTKHPEAIPTVMLLKVIKFDFFATLQSFLAGSSPCPCLQSTSSGREFGGRPLQIYGLPVRL